jgi:cytochrome c biogenesis protein
MWQFFISLRLTFVLLAILAVGAVLGMSYDQTLSFDEFLAKKSGNSVASFLISFFELNDAFHSWWFSLAILFLSGNLIACSIERLPRIYFDVMRPRPFLTNRRLLGLTLKSERVVETESEAKELLRQFFGSMPKAKELGGESYYFRDKHRYARFGVYVVHIALLVVMFSSVYATQKGLDGNVIIEEGQKTRFITAKGAGGVTYSHDLGFYIGCKDFRLRTFLDNSPMEFESDLFIADQAKNILAEKTVRVNEPLSYAGFTFYQSTFQPLISEKIVELLVSDGKNYKERMRTELGRELTLPNKDRITAQKFYEDFAGLGQALRIQKISPNGEKNYFHIFRRYPDFDKKVRNDHYELQFTDIDQRYATGLSVGKVPGISIIFSGFLLLVLGIFLCFFVTPVRLFARLTRDEEGYRLSFAAQGFRNMQLVRADFCRRSKANLATEALDHD